MSMLDSKEELLHRIFGTITLEKFFSDYWEQKPFHIGRDDSDHFSSYLTVADVESLIVNLALYFPKVQLSAGASKVPPEQYLGSDNKIVATRFLQGHAEGATIVLSQAHDLFPSLAHLKRTMQGALQLECQTNVYLSPAGQSGFNPHYDSHDVIILQVSGSKTFRFYGGGPFLPFAAERFDAERDKSGSESQSVHLKPGDVLYIPRGMMHDAIADEHEPSLHITVGVYAITWLDLFQGVLNKQAGKQEQMRKSIPRNYWRDDREFKNFSEEVKRQLPHATDLLIEDALTVMRNEVALGSSADCEGLLKRITGQTPLDANTNIQLLPGRIISTSKKSDRLILRCHGQVLEFQEPFATGIESLLSKRSLTLGQFPALDGQQRRALVTQLLSENLVEIR